MSTEHDLRDALRDAERLAPDPAPVAARVAAGVRSRRRHRVAGLTTAAVAIAAAAAVAVPSVLLSGPDGRTPAPISPASAPAPSTQQVRFEPLTVPFTVGFLPAGWHADGTLSTDRGQATRRYEGPRWDDQLMVQLWDTRISGEPAGTGSSTGAGAGAGSGSGTAPRPDARSTGDTGTEARTPANGGRGGNTVQRRVGGDVWLMVSGTPPTAVLQQVLRSVSVGRTERLTFPFRFGWLPDGYRVVNGSSGAHYWLGDGAEAPRTPPLLDAGLSLDRVPGGDRTNFSGLTIGVVTEDGMWADKGIQANGTLLGRPSRYTEDHGLVELHVFDLHGMHVLVSGTKDRRPELDQAALERIVRELRFVPTPTRPDNWTPHPLP